MKKGEDVSLNRHEETCSKAMDTGPVKEASGAAGKVVSHLLIARKNLSLYPENHTVCMNTLAQFHAQLQAYLHTYGDMRLEIESDKITTGGETVHAEPTEEGALPFILFRDGIRWLTFTPGIEADELKDFLSVLNKYNIISNASEGDIVTAFWERKFTHITYEVADFSWGDGQDAGNTPSFDEWDHESKTLEEKASWEKELDFTIRNKKGADVAVSLRENNLVDWETLTDPAIDQASLIFTPEEKATVRNMIRVEEDSGPAEFLDALMDSLLGLREQENFKIILAVLGEEFRNSLTQRDFDITLKILQNLRCVIDLCATDIPWASSLIEDFFLDISSQQSLRPLQAPLTDLDSSQMKMIEQFLKLLHPEAINSLGAILLENHSSQLRHVIEDAMASLASRDIRPLETLFKAADDMLVRMLVPVLVNVKGEQPPRILLKLVHHKSEYIRLVAVKGLLKMGPARIQDLFKLIDDKDETMRTIILKQIGQSKDRVAESLLLNYLEHKKFKSTDNQHALDCFIALGKCGSRRSIPFLHRTLFNKGWLPNFLGSVHREGAAIALSILGLKEARLVLEKAGRCLFPSVRSIVRKVKQEMA
jgi:hypothetical protein